MRALRSLGTLAAFAVGAVILLGSVPAFAQGTCPMAKPSRKYPVRIETAPPGATVYLDRKDCGAVGVTPWEGKLASGDVTVIVELAGYDLGSKTVKVARTRKVASNTHFVPLVKKVDPPKIDIGAAADKNVFDAEVWLDGQNQGRAPVILTTTPGRHQVEIRKAGFENYSQWVTTQDNGTVSVNPVLKEIPKPKFGNVLVDADVPDAEVYIDGNKHPDRTPTIIRNVVEGLHVVEVRKDPAIPWKQTIQVITGQDTKVQADLKASMGGQGGNIRVLSNVDGARVFLDGKDEGAVPLDLKDIKPGEHVIEVKAPGYKIREERVTVQTGQATTLKLDLSPSGDGTLKVVSPVPEADVFIDGAPAGKVPVEKGVSSGEHFVVVKLAGFKTFEQKVRVEAGQDITVSAELKAVGKLRILSQPPGANVNINGIDSGETPLEIEWEVGETVVRVTSAGFRPVERTLQIEGGKTETISAELEVAGPSPEDLLAEQRGLSHFGARTLNRGRSTVSADAGYPYFAEVRINVGAGRVGQFGFDAGVAARTNLARNEIGLGVRLMLVDQDPFSAGAFADLWWGSKLLDDSKRNGVTFNAGALASLTALSHVTITGRAYVNMWSDRHCPELMSGQFDGDPIDACAGYAAMRGLGGPGAPMGFTAEDADRMETLTGEMGQDMFGRDSGIRFMLGVVAEIAVQQRWSLYGILEGAPFQEERALFTQLFSGPMFDSDFGTYLRLGVTYKF
jgi:hypothetical protein